MLIATIVLLLEARNKNIKSECTSAPQPQEVIRENPKPIVAIPEPMSPNQLLDSFLNEIPPKRCAILSSVNFRCDNSQLTNWNAKEKSNLKVMGHQNIQKVPYSNVNLINKAGSASPIYHYPEVVVLLKNHIIKNAVYLDSADQYLALLIGTLT